MLIFSLLFISQGAHAATWSSSASACVPSDGSVGKYDFEDATLKFSANSTGEILVRCHITNPFDDTDSAPIWNTLTVGYQDPDAHEQAYQVEAKLIRVNKGTGVVSVITPRFDSNASTAPNTVSPVSGFVKFTHNYNFTTYAYYITLDLHRSDSLKNPAVWFVKLSVTD